MRIFNKNLLCAALLASVYMPYLSAMNELVLPVLSLRKELTETFSLAQNMPSSKNELPNVSMTESMIGAPSELVDSIIGGLWEPQKIYAKFMAEISGDKPHSMTLSIVKRIISRYSDEICMKDLDIFYTILSKNTYDPQADTDIAVHMLNLLAIVWAAEERTSYAIDPKLFPTLIRIIENPAVSRVYKNLVMQVLCLNGTVKFTTVSLRKALDEFVHKNEKIKFELFISLIKKGQIDWEHPSKIANVILNLLNGPSPTFITNERRFSIISALLQQELYRKNYLNKSRQPTFNKHYKTLSKWAYICPDAPENYKVPENELQLREGAHLPSLYPNIKNSLPIEDIYQAWIFSKATLTRENASSLLTPHDKDLREKRSREKKPYEEDLQSAFLQNFFSTPGRLESTDLSYLSLLGLLSFDSKCTQVQGVWKNKLLQNYIGTQNVKNGHHLPDFSALYDLGKHTYLQSLRAWKLPQVIINHENLNKLFPNNKEKLTWRDQSRLDAHINFLKEIFNSPSKFRASNLTYYDLQAMLENKNLDSKKWKTLLTGTLLPKIAFTGKNLNHKCADLFISDSNEDIIINNHMAPLMEALVQEDLPPHENQKLVCGLNTHTSYPEHQKTLILKEQPPYFPTRKETDEDLYEPSAHGSKAEKLNKALFPSPFSFEGSISDPDARTLQITEGLELTILPSLQMGEKEPHPAELAQKEATTEAEKRPLMEWAGEEEVKVENTCLAQSKILEEDRRNRAAIFAEKEDAPLKETERMEIARAKAQMEALSTWKPALEKAFSPFSPQAPWTGMEKAFSLFSPQAPWTGMETVDMGKITPINRARINFPE